MGLTLALLSGFSFAVSNIFVRKGTYRSGESVTAVVITAFMGLVLFGIPLLITGQFTRLGSVSWLALGSLAAAGIVHFSIGRMLGFSAIRLIGANRAVPIQTCYILIAAFLGVFFLGEHLSTGLILALIFRGGMGWGVVKMAALIREATVFPQVFVALFLGIVLGGLVAGLLLVLKIKKRKEPIPFGPFLSLAAIITLLRGSNILDWYLSSFS